MLSNVWAFLFYYVLADTGLYAKGQSKSSASSSSDFGRRFFMLSERFWEFACMVSTWFGRFSVA